MINQVGQSEQIQLAIREGLELRATRLQVWSCNLLAMLLIKHTHPSVSSASAPE